MDPTILVIIIGAAVIVLVFLRTRRQPRESTVTRRHWEEYKRQQDEYEAASEPEYRLKDVGQGGHLHLSLPKGLEEDFTVVRRDRIDRHDEQIEYDLMLEGADPEHPLWLNWWTVGVYTHAWLLEPSHYSLEQLELNPGLLDEMKRSGEGSLNYRDEPYALEIAGDWLLYEGGRRPAKDFRRWDFRNEKGNRSIVIQERPWEEPQIRVYNGQEIWLRDLTVRVPSAPSSQSGSTQENGTQSGGE